MESDATIDSWIETNAITAQTRKKEQNDEKQSIQPGVQRFQSPTSNTQSYEEYSANRLEDGGSSPGVNDR